MAEKTFSVHPLTCGEYGIVKNGSCNCRYDCVTESSYCNKAHCRNRGIPNRGRGLHSDSPKLPCICSKWFNGPCCQIPICINGGTLLNGTCQCPASVFGQNCHLLKCLQPGSTYNETTDGCNCAPGWDGARCQRPACQNKGKWNQTLRRCVCPKNSEFTGNYCHLVTCIHGRWTYDSITNEQTCICPVTHTGPRCGTVNVGAITGVIVGAVILFLIIMILLGFVGVGCYRLWLKRKRACISITPSSTAPHGGTESALAARRQTPVHPDIIVDPLSADKFRGSLTERRGTPYPGLLPSTPAMDGNEDQRSSPSLMSSK